MGRKRTHTTVVDGGAKPGDLRNPPRSGCWTQKSPVGERKSRKKRDIVCPYPPDYVTREEIAYRLMVSERLVDKWAERGLLPAPCHVFTVDRYRWSDIEDAVAEQNLLALDQPADPTSDEDGFIAGLKRVATTDS